MLLLSIEQETILAGRYELTDVRSGRARRKAGLAVNIHWAWHK